MTTDADDALIARLLAEDQAYSYHGTFDGLASDTSEEKHSTRKKKSKKRGEMRIRGPASNGGKDVRKEAVVARPVDRTGTGRRKRKDHGAAREAGKTWSDDEERLFLEALNVHGEAPCDPFVQGEVSSLPGAFRVCACIQPGVTCSHN